MTFITSFGNKIYTLGPQILSNGMQEMILLILSDLINIIANIIDMMEKQVIVDLILMLKLPFFILLSILLKIKKWLQWLKMIQFQVLIT